MLALDFTLVGVTVSYLLLGLFATSAAANLWALYAVVVFVLAVADLICDRKRQRRRKERHARPAH